MPDKQRPCWILGNAPTLAKFDLSKLADKPTFSFNRAYLSYGEGGWGWYPTYYMIIDLFMLSQMYGDVNQLIETSPIQRFFINGATFKGFDPKREIVDSGKVEWLTLRDDWGFDPVSMKYCGDVSACALQVAYRLGYRKAYLLGVDQSWGEQGEAKPGEDRDHFRPDYESEAVRMSPVYKDAHYNSWVTSIQEARGYGFNIVSASPYSRLNPHLRVEQYEEILK